MLSVIKSIKKILILSGGVSGPNLREKIEELKNKLFMNKTDK